MGIRSVVAVAVVLMACPTVLVVGEETTIDVSAWQDVPVRKPGGKLVGFAWGMPSPSQLRDTMPALEAGAPFLDGIVFKLPETDDSGWPPWLPAFDRRAWTEEDVALDTLRDIRWGQFKHNFISLGPGPSYDEALVSWFDDDGWTVVENNLRLLSQALQVSGARGVFFDVENYSGLWHYWHRVSLTADPPVKICHYPGFTFAQVEAKVRQRGRQFIEALQTRKPDVVVFATALFSGCGAGPAEVETSLFPLLRAFTAGMLDGATPGVVFVNGVENTYWTNASDGYLWWYDAMKTRSLAVAPDPSSRDAWQRQSSSGMAVFYDALHDGLYTDKLPVEQTYRLKWLEHNLYHGLLANDEWTWLYFERANPWGNPGLPETAVKALMQGREKALNGRPLGWTMVWKSLSEPIPSKVFPTPACRIVEPSAGMVVKAGDAVMVEVAAAGDAQLTSVVLYLDGRSAGTLPTAPFRAVLTGMPPGFHSLVAQGFFVGDADRGLTAPVVVEVKPKEAVVDPH